MSDESDTRMTVVGFKTDPAEEQQEHARLQSKRLRMSPVSGDHVCQDRPRWLLGSILGSDLKPIATTGEAVGAGLGRGRTTTPATSMPAKIERLPAREQDRSSITHDQPQQNFFSLKAGRRTHRRGAPAPLTTAAGGRSLPIRQARPQQHAGRQACGLPPASQHDAVCGGGANPTVTASCCDGGLGGGRHA